MKCFRLSLNYDACHSNWYLPNYNFIIFLWNTTYINCIISFWILTLSHKVHIIILESWDQCMSISNLLTHVTDSHWKLRSCRNFWPNLLKLSNIWSISLFSKENLKKHWNTKIKQVYIAFYPCLYDNRRLIWWRLTNIF